MVVKEKWQWKNEEMRKENKHMERDTVNHEIFVRKYFVQKNSQEQSSHKKFNVNVLVILYKEHTRSMQQRVSSGI